MKKVLFGLVFVSLVCAVAFAQTEPVVTETVTPASISIVDVVKSLPALKQGVAYSIIDSKFNYITTIDLANYKGANLEVGYAGAAKETGDKLVAVVSYDLWNAKAAGITIPVLDLIKFRPGVYAGVGRVDIAGTGAAKANNEFDWGVSATIIDVKF